MRVHYHHKAECTKAGCGCDPCFRVCYGPDPEQQRQARENLRRVELMKFCPICGERLETPPISGLPACFAHGDVVIRGDEVLFRQSRSL